MKNSNLYNKKILEYCPNFEKIINADFYEDDHITKKIIKLYEDYISSADIANKENLEKVVELDKIINKYLEDYHFRGELQKSLTEIKVTSKVKDIVDFIVTSIIGIFNNYKEGYTRKIYIPRWI